MGGNAAVCVSAPGKVLLAGGYLVLDRAHTGLVFGLDARIHVVVQNVSTQRGVTLQEITVKSPQFLGAIWHYGYRMAGRDGGVDVTQLRVDADQNLDRNNFVETALAFALTYITSVGTLHIEPAQITILADNDYYTTPSELADGSGTAPPRFHDFGVALSKANKTGLGSSAALVTAFTAALLTHYLPESSFDIATETGKRRLHNLAQAAHCAAQGKVGSGFDVASAVFGSCLYRRFSPTILADHIESGSKGFAAQLHDVVNEEGEMGAWDTEILKDQVRVPQGLRLVMCDVSCGSQTPGMVKKVLAWRQEKPEEAKAIWHDLQKANDGLAKEMKALAETKGTDHDTLKACFTTIRKGIRLMSEKSGVPIEPPAQTALINACEQTPGVIGGVVPGAGGYDAISLLIEDREDVVTDLERLFSRWKFNSRDGDAKRGGGIVSMLGVREEMQGVKMEDVTAYQSWLD